MNAAPKLNLMPSPVRLKTFGTTATNANEFFAGPTRLSRDLDDDSVDGDIYDEELRFRQEHEPTCRGNTLRLLDSNPLQVALYVLVVLDAVVVIAEIMLDLHAMRSQYREATADLSRAMEFLKDVYADDLEGYDGNSTQYVLDTLRARNVPPCGPCSFGGRQAITNTSVGMEGEERRNSTAGEGVDPPPLVLLRIRRQFKNQIRPPSINVTGQLFNNNRSFVIGRNSVANENVGVNDDVTTTTSAGASITTKSGCNNCDVTKRMPRTISNEVGSFVTSEPKSMTAGMHVIDDDVVEVKIVTQFDKRTRRRREIARVEYDGLGTPSQVSKIVATTVSAGQSRSHAVKNNVSNKFDMQKTLRRSATTPKSADGRVARDINDRGGDVMTKGAVEAGVVAQAANEVNHALSTPISSSSISFVFSPYSSSSSSFSTPLPSASDSSSLSPSSSSSSVSSLFTPLPISTSSHSIHASLQPASFTTQKLINYAKTKRSSFGITNINNESSSAVPNTTANDAVEELDYFLSAADLPDMNSSAVNIEDASEMARNGSSTYDEHHTYAEDLLKIAHIFHYVGIGILGFFVLQVFLKMFGMGLEFCKKKYEIFDAVIVLTSFSLDLVFVEGISGSQSEEAIALLIVFLLWRILRIVNGIMITSKKRQDFRIQLQKRARRRAHKKIEYLEDDKNWKEREIVNLRHLCMERGAAEDEIALCKPRRRTIFQKMDTSVGLSSIASLSLGLSMSMTGAGRQVIKNLSTGAPIITTTPDRRQSSAVHLQASRSPLMSSPGGPMGSRACRRTSFVGILHQMSTQNRLMERSMLAGGAMSSTDTLGGSPARMSQVTEEDVEQGGVEGGTRIDGEPGDESLRRIGKEMNGSASRDISKCDERALIPDVVIHAADTYDSDCGSPFKIDSPTASVNSSRGSSCGGGRDPGSFLEEDLVEGTACDPVDDFAHPTCGYLRSRSSSNHDDSPLSIGPYHSYVGTGSGALTAALRGSSHSLPQLPQLSRRESQKRSTTRRPTHLSLTALCRPVAAPAPPIVTSSMSTSRMTSAARRRTKAVDDDQTLRSNSDARQAKISAIKSNSVGSEQAGGRGNTQGRKMTRQTAIVGFLPTTPETSPMQEQCSVRPVGLNYEPRESLFSQDRLTVATSTTDIHTPGVNLTASKESRTLVKAHTLPLDAMSLTFKRLDHQHHYEAPTDFRTIPTSITSSIYSTDVYNNQNLPNSTRHNVVNTARAAPAAAKIERTDIPLIVNKVGPHLPHQQQGNHSTSSAGGGRHGSRRKLEATTSVVSENGNLRCDVSDDVRRSTPSVHTAWSTDNNSNTDIGHYVHVANERPSFGASIDRGRLSVCGELRGGGAPGRRSGGSNASSSLSNYFDLRRSTEAIRMTLRGLANSRSHDASHEMTSSRDASSTSWTNWSKSQDMTLGMSPGDMSDMWSRSQEQLQLKPACVYQGKRRKSAHCIGIHSDRVSPNQL